MLHDSLGKELFNALEAKPLRLIDQLLNWHLLTFL